MLRVGVIGFGQRAAGMLGNFSIFNMGAEIVAIFDHNPEEVKKLMAREKMVEERVTIYADVDTMMKEANLDGVCIATNCDSHTEYAIQVMKYNVPLLLEKPVSITMEQLDKLEEAGKGFSQQTLVSFPLRASSLCKLAKEIIDRGDLGEINHVEAVNNVTYGRVYYKSWYRDESITGGLFLQKSTHDLDYINYLLGQRPVQIAAMESKHFFKGDKEPGLTCSECPENRNCTESPHVLKNLYSNEDPSGDGCSFAKDTGNHDSASILVKYENGIHAVYTQDFIARKDAAKRGAIVIGYKATLEFDWITGELKVYSHTSPRNEVHVIKNNHLFHYGGDKALCENFVAIMRGEGDSIAPLASGIESARMCLIAEKSAKTSQFYNL